MRAIFYPGTFVPGAVLLRDKDGIVVRDKKRRPIWDMPKPSSVVKHKRGEVFTCVGRDEDGKPIWDKRERGEVPVYRGMPAPVARCMRAAARRDTLKRRVKSAAAKATDALKDLIKDMEDG